MHTKQILLAAAIAASLALAGCGNDGADDAAANDPALDTAAADTAGADDTGPLDAVTAGETLALVTAVDQHEVDMAQQARDKGVTGDVLAYADMLHEDHSANLEKDRTLAADTGIEPAATAIVGAQQSKGAAVMQRLAELEGEEYARAFVDAMVQGHADALAMLDERIGTTSDAALKQHLTATRETIAAHLEHGQSLQDDGATDADADTGATE